VDTNGRRAPLGAGEPAPEFTLPAAHADGTIAFAEYRSQSPVLVALFRGLY
jgi:peroxiredoxin